MCHVMESPEFIESDGTKLVYKAAIEYIYRGKKEYFSPFIHSEIKLNQLMTDPNYTHRKPNETVEYGYYHFFDSLTDALKFVKHWVKIDNTFDKNLKPCVIIGRIPKYQTYNKGYFMFDYTEYNSIISATVDYTGEVKYEYDEA